MPGRKPAWNVLSLCIETSKAQKRSVVHISKYGILNVKNPLGGVSYNKIKGELDAALAFHLSILPHARRLPAYQTTAAKLQTAWAKIVQHERGLISRVSRLFHFGLSPGSTPVSLTSGADAARSYLLPSKRGP